MEQPNHLRSRLEADDVALGVQLASGSRAMLEVLGDLGLDFAWLDLEHKGPSPYDSDRLEEYARASEVSGIDLLVRIPGSDPHMIRKILDTGIRNIVVPTVETADEARSAVRASRFEYDGAPGDRGASFARANRWGDAGDDDARTEDGRVCLGVMIENQVGMENLTDILDVEGLGFVRPGPGDLSVSLGHGVDKSHPAVAAQIETIESTARDAGVPLSGGVGDAEAVAIAVDRGYRVLTIGRDITAVRTVLGERHETARELI